MALVQTVRGHRGEVSCVDLTWGGLLATGGGDRMVRLWRWGGSCFLEEGAAAQHRLGVTVVKFSPYGAALASAGREGAVRVWRVAGAGGPRSWRELVVPGGTGVRALVWGVGGEVDVLASGGDGGDVCVWGVRRGVLLRRMAVREEAGGVTALVTVNGGMLLVGTLTGGGLAVWTVTGGEEAHVTDVVHDLGALCACWLQERGMLATGGQDAALRLWEVRGERDLQQVGVLEGHSSAVTGVCWLRGGGRGERGEELASCSLDRSVRVWHVESGGGARAILGFHTRYVTSLASCPTGTLLVSSSNDHTVRVWSLKGRYPEVMTPPCLALDHFALGDLQGIEPPPDDQPDVGPVPESEVHCEWSDRQTHEAAINSVCTWRHLLVTACSDRAVRVWERSAEGARLLHCLLAHYYPATSALPLPPHGGAILSAGLDGQLLLWDLQSGSRTGGATYGSGSGCAGGGGLRSVAVSPRPPHLVLTASDDQVAPVWRLHEHALSVEHVYEGYEDGVWCCAWSPGGRAAVTGGAGGELRVYSPPPASALLLLRDNAHDLGVQCCDFALHDGEEDSGDYILATGGCDSVGRVWRLVVKVGGADLHLLHELCGHGGTVTCCRYSSLGALLATGATDHHVRLWSPDGHCVHTITLQAGVGGVAFWGGEGGGEVSLVIGTLDGELSVWSVPVERQLGASGEGSGDDGEGSGLLGSDEGAARGWGEQRVTWWLREHVTRAPEAGEARLLETRLVSRVVERGVRGERLLDSPVDELLSDLGVDEPESWCNYLVRRELWWLQAAAHLSTSAAQCDVPHALRCPLTHAPLVVATAGGDGRTYERAALREWLQLAGGTWPTAPLCPLPDHPRLPLNYSAISAARAALLPTLAGLLPEHPSLPAPREHPPHT